MATDELPPRSGPCCVGLDLGFHKSFTSAACYWPATGRLEVLTACPTVPGLAARARADAAGELYERAHADGVLMPLAGQLTPVGAFLERLKSHLAGYQVSVVGCDQVRRVELMQHLSALELLWRPVWRGAGIRSTELASGDIRAFQLATTAAGCVSRGTSCSRTASPNLIS